MNPKLVQVVSTGKGVNQTSIQLIPLSTDISRKRAQSTQMTLEKTDGKWAVSSGMVQTVCQTELCTGPFWPIIHSDQLRRGSTGTIKTDEKRTVVLTLDKADGEGKAFLTNYYVTGFKQELLHEFCF